MLLDYLLPTPCVYCAKSGKPVCDSCFEQIETEPKEVLLEGLIGYSFSNYRGHSSTLVQNIKETSYTALIPFVASLMARSWPFQEDVALVPIPSSKANYRKRGFHHTLLLSRAIAQRVPNVKVLDLLASVGNRKDQVGLSPRAREENLLGAFRVKAGAGAMTLVLLDDVLTTGATLREAARTLADTGLAVSGFCVFAQTEPKKPSK